MMRTVRRGVGSSVEPGGGSAAPAVKHGSYLIRGKICVDQFVDGILRVFGA